MSEHIDLGIFCRTCADNECPEPCRAVVEAVPMHTSYEVNWNKTRCECGCHGKWTLWHTILHPIEYRQRLAWKRDQKQTENSFADSLMFAIDRGEKTADHATQELRAGIKRIRGQAYEER